MATSPQPTEPLYSGVEVCRALDLTYRRLDYWTRTNKLHPVNAAGGSGSRRGYSRTDVIVADALRALYDAGANPAVTAAAAASLYAAASGAGRLPKAIIVTSTGELIDLPALVDPDTVDAYGWLIRLTDVDAALAELPRGRVYANSPGQVERYAW